MSSADELRAILQNRKRVHDAEAHLAVEDEPQAPSAAHVKKEEPKPTAI